MRGNDFKQKEDRFGLAARKTYFTGRVVRHWSRLPGSAPFLEVLKVGRGSEQPVLVKGIPAHGRGLEIDDLQRPF